MDERGKVRELTEDEAAATSRPKLTSSEVAKRLKTVSRDAAGLYAYYVDRARSKLSAVSRNRAAKDLHVQAWQVRAWQQELVQAGLLDVPDMEPPKPPKRIMAVLDETDREWWREAARRCVCARDGVMTHEQMMEHAGVVADGIYRLLGEERPAQIGAPAPARE